VLARFVERRSATTSQKVSRVTLLRATKMRLQTRLYKFSLTQEVTIRIGLSVLFVTFTHQLQWQSLRMVTSEAILRTSLAMGMSVFRVSADTINVNGTFFQFVTACTFVDVFMAAIPLVWNLQTSAARNLIELFALAVTLFGLNIVRLQTAQVLFAHGASWNVADQVVGGFAYFAVWLLVWRLIALRLLTLRRSRDHRIVE
jgi:hypothetical protein